MTAKGNDRSRSKAGDARRSRNQSANRSGGGRKRSQKGGKSPQQDGGSTSKRRGRSSGSRKNRQRSAPSEPGDAFWGEQTTLPPAETDVRINDDPAAVPRSLGPPPLPGHEAIAEHYFAAVYDRAVATAGALAAAGGLIDPDALTDDADR